jgi:hypothetical protein
MDGFGPICKLKCTTHHQLWIIRNGICFKRIDIGLKARFRLFISFGPLDKCNMAITVHWLPPSGKRQDSVQGQNRALNLLRHLRGIPLADGSMRKTLFVHIRLWAPYELTLFVNDPITLLRNPRSAYSSDGVCPCEMHKPGHFHGAEVVGAGVAG